jgi:tetratricopeptide (TPR) repeat protein
MMLVALFAASVVSAPIARAGIFGGKSASPTPSPVPSALPTASPEPASVAIPRLEARLKTNPNDQQAMSELAGQFLQINRPDLAVQVSQRLLQMGDKNAQTYYLDGYAMEMLNHNDQAIADLEQAENLDPSNIGVLDQLVELYLKGNRFADAERIANRSMVLNKGDEESYQMLGAVYAAEQKFDLARTQFETAATKAPKDPQPIFQIAQTYANQDNIPMAIQTIDRAIAIDPKNVQALVFKATLYARQHIDDKASEAFDDAIVAAPDDSSKVQIVVQKAAYFNGEKKPQQAETILLQGIAQYPKMPDIYVAYGDFEAQQKNMEKAKQEWQQALTIDNNNVEALTRLSQTALQAHSFPEAIGYLKRLTQLQPDPTTFALLGQAYSYTHNYADSKDACSKSFELARSPQTLSCIGGADFELHNYKEAAQIFDVLDHNARGFLDQNPQLMVVAGKTYESDHQKAKALAMYKRLLPLAKKGSKEYAEIQGWIAQVSKH